MEKRFTKAILKQKMRKAKDEAQYKKEITLKTKKLEKLKKDQEYELKKEENIKANLEKFNKKNDNDEEYLLKQKSCSKLERRIITRSKNKAVIKFEEDYKKLKQKRDNVDKKLIHSNLNLFLIVRNKLLDTALIPDLITIVMEYFETYKQYTSQTLCLCISCEKYKKECVLGHLDCNCQSKTHTQLPIKRKSGHEKFRCSISCRLCCPKKHYLIIEKDSIEKFGKADRTFGHEHIDTKVLPITYGDEYSPPKWKFDVICYSQSECDNNYVPLHSLFCKCYDIDA